MKVSLIYDFLTELGGLERLMANHAKMLQEEGFEVEILTFHFDKEVVERAGLDSTRIRIIAPIRTKSEFLNIFLSLFLACFRIDKLSNYKTDLIICYSFPGNFVTRRIKARKINYMNHFPNFLYLPSGEKKIWARSTLGFKREIARMASIFFGGFLKRLDKKLVMQCQLILVNSNFTKKRLDDLYGINAVVCYPPVGNVIRPAKKKINRKFILVAGRIIPDKKIEWAIEACSIMKTKAPLVVSGRGSQEFLVKLKKLASEKKVTLETADHPIDKLIEHYTSASVIACPTPLEDFGLVPAEGLTCGTPVVVWGDGSGPTEQVIDGVNGYYAKPYDTTDFAAKVEKIVSSDFKKSQREIILKSAEKFSYASIKGDFVDLINSVIRINELP